MAPSSPQKVVSAHAWRHAPQRSPIKVRKSLPRHRAGGEASPQKNRKQQVTAAAPRVTTRCRKASLATLWSYIAKDHHQRIEPTTCTGSTPNDDSLPDDGIAATAHGDGVKHQLTIDMSHLFEDATFAGPPSFSVPDWYDYSRTTAKNYRNNKVKDLVGDFVYARKVVYAMSDPGYHVNYTRARQRWQDCVVHTYMNSVPSQKVFQVPLGGDSEPLVVVNPLSHDGPYSQPLQTQSMRGGSTQCKGKASEEAGTSGSSPPPPPWVVFMCGMVGAGKR